MTTFPFIFNIAKGKEVGLAELPLAADSFVAVYLKAAGLESPEVLDGYDTLAAILAAANDEATGIPRVSISSANVTIATDDTNDWQTIALSTISSTPTGVESTGAILICYDNDTGAGSDSNLIPIYADAYVVTSAIGTPVTFTMAQPIMKAA